MEITNVQIKYLKKGGFNCVNNENVKHIKVLPHLSVVQSVEGSYEISLGSGKTLQTSEGGFFVAPSNVQQTIVHHVSKKSGKMTARWIFIDVEINKSFSLDALYQFATVINDERKEELNVLFDRLFETDNIWKNYSDCYALIERLIQTATPVKSKSHIAIQRTVSHMKENYEKKITVRELANIARMSEANFYAVFKKNMGISPIAYLNNYRLSVAADRLTDTSDTVSEIGYSVGINDPLYFSKTFKKIYGMAPREYRSVYQNKQKRSIT